MTIDSKQLPHFSRLILTLTVLSYGAGGRIQSLSHEYLPAQSPSVAPLGNQNTSAHSGTLPAMTPRQPSTTARLSLRNSQFLL